MREETKSTLYPSAPNMRGQSGGSFVLSQWLMIQGTRESKILGGSGCFVRFSYFMYVACAAGGIVWLKFWRRSRDPKKGRLSTQYCQLCRLSCTWHVVVSPYFRHLDLVLNGFRVFASGCRCFLGGCRSCVEVCVGVCSIFWSGCRWL